MRAVCQRVSRASVSVDGVVHAEIGVGLLVLLGVARGDERATADRLAAKVAHLRIFEEERGKFDRSLIDVGGAALSVSQFTLIADTRRGNRPSFIDAAPPEDAAALYADFNASLRSHGVRVETGVFGARMSIALTNEGPVTIVLD
jgi:D-tyrosyl-tRNA(Tyr) deacylase